MAIKLLNKEAPYDLVFVSEATLCLGYKSYETDLMNEVVALQICKLRTLLMNEVVALQICKLRTLDNVHRTIISSVTLACREGKMQGKDVKDIYFEPTKVELQLDGSYVVTMRIYVDVNGEVK